VTVVVGADGFVGGALASALGAARVVFGPAREPADTPFDEAGALLSKAGVIVNASGFRVRPGLGAADYRRTHAETVARLVPALTPGSLLIHTSSASVLGRSPSALPPNDEAGSPETFGCPDYAIAKRDAERAARAAASERGVRLVILRPAILYGRVPDGMIGTLAALAARGVLLRLVPARHRHHLCALPLLVETVRAVVRKGRAIETPLAVADPFFVTSCEIAGLVREMHGPAVSLPFPAGVAGAVMRRFPRSSSPRLDLRTWGEILCILALDTVYDTAETYRLLGIDVSRFSRPHTWERLARGQEAEA
jgi:nucleoside-diphosphate-sugar epimerase